jgi:predicted  nucleic acid-binding Zn-ribbon protein
MNPPPIVSNKDDRDTFQGWPMPGERNTPQANMTPQERVEMIEKLYQEVLGRKPDTRDVNYYKYSTLGEEEIRKQLITGKEHKQLIEDGREFNKVKDRASQAETRVRMLESQVKDQVEEFKHLTELLKEKNKYIQDFREKSNNTYARLNPQKSRSDNSGQVFTAPASEIIPKKADKQQKFIEKLLSNFLP